RSGRRPSRSRPAGASRPRTPASRRPLPQGDTFATPNPSPLRAGVERRSATLLVFLHRLPRWVPLMLMLALLAAALLVKGVLGAVFLVALAVILVWLAFVSWPMLRPGDRAFRALAIVVVLAGAAYFALIG
ncbi:MAG TPA: DUF6703 family protein, partial [Streptosporangiales bacterium]